MIDRRIHSFKNAWRGIALAWKEELNFRVQSILAAITIGAGWFFGISVLEWMLVFLVIGFVLVAEAFNTALEELCDKFTSEHDPHIGKIKDIAAGAVFLASLAALAVGLMIFVPHITSV